MLRIWPLYFLLVFIGTIGLPFAFGYLNIDYKMPYNLEQTWFYFLFFIPGLVTFYFGHHFLEPLWSIGVEEVFYLIWAPLFKINKNKILLLLVLIILIHLTLNFIGVFAIHNELFNFIIGTFKFDAIAIGGLGAYFLYKNQKPITNLFIFKPPIQIIVFVTVIFYLIFHSNIDNFFWNTLFKTPIFSSILIEIIYLYVIICVSSVDHSIVKLRNETLSFLGEISYGIYMYHMLVVFGAILLMKKYLIQMSSFSSHLLFYTTITIITFILSILSKYLFENYFLKLKSRLE